MGGARPAYLLLAPFRDAFLGCGHHGRQRVAQDEVLGRATVTTSKAASNNYFGLVCAPHLDEVRSCCASCQMSVHAMLSAYTVVGMRVARADARLRSRLCAGARLRATRVRRECAAERGGGHLARGEGAHHGPWGRAPCR